MKRLLIKTCFLSAALLFSVVTYGQQGGQMNSGNKANPVNAGKQNQQGQTMSNPADSSGSQVGQTSKNDDYRPELQPGESYPVNQNLDINKENLINPLNNQPARIGGQNNQDQVTPGVQNQGNPAQTLPAGQGSQSVPGNTGNGQKNQINPGINNNPGVPNDQGTQNPVNIKKDRDKPGQSGQKP